MQATSPAGTLIADTQSAPDARHLPIHRVGIKNVRYPFQLLLDSTQGPQIVQSTVGQWDLDVALAAEQKGTHMSRFVAWLQALPNPLEHARLRVAAADMVTLLQASQGRIEVRFPFFLNKRAPVSGVESLLEYQGRWMVQQGPRGNQLWAEVTVPVKSLCPCSKEISDYGAHNQRSHVTIKVELLGNLGWRDLVRCAEDNASCEIWALLKRADEKWVTEKAFDNPKFVEDMVRDVALALNKLPQVGRYSVSVENFESIHAHSAFAHIER